MRGIFLCSITILQTALHFLLHTTYVYLVAKCTALFFFFSDNYLLLPSGNLQIISVSAEHQGMYKCGAANPVTGEHVVQSQGVKLSVKSE